MAGKRIPVIIDNQGNKEIFIVQNGRTPNVAQITIAAKHNTLLSEVPNDPHKAARLFVYGIPKSENKASKVDCILLENKALNIPDANAGQEMITVFDVQFTSDDYIGFFMELEVLPYNDTLLDLTGVAYSGGKSQTTSYLKNGYRIWIGWNYTTQLEEGNNPN